MLIDKLKLFWQEIPGPMRLNNHIKQVRQTVETFYIGIPHTEILIVYVCPYFILEYY